MPFTSGTYSLPTGNPVVTGTTISSTTTNTTNSDIATALSACLLKDGTQTVTANIPMASHKFTGLSAGTTAGDSARYDELILKANLTSLGNFQGAIQTTSAATLTFANVGQLIVIGGGTSSITLPLLSAVADGSTLTFIAQIGTTISRQGSDTLYTSTGGAVTSVTLAGLDTTLQLTKTSGVWYINGGSYLQKAITIPQVTVYTTGSGTYTTPSNTKYLSVKMIGGGGGGGGGGNGGAGGTGGTTTFGTSILTCGGGGGGSNSSGSAIAIGGSATNTLGVGVAFAGSQGSGGSGQSNIQVGYTTAMAGGASPFGGNGAGVSNQAGGNAVDATGSGAGGGGAIAGVATVGGGGASGGYIDAIITSPSATYSFAVAAGGTAGTAGASAYAGGVGAGGVIFITAYF